MLGESHESGSERKRAKRKVTDLEVTMRQPPAPAPHFQVFACMRTALWWPFSARPLLDRDAISSSSAKLPCAHAAQDGPHPCNHITPQQKKRTWVSGPMSYVDQLPVLSAEAVATVAPPAVAWPARPAPRIALEDSR